MEIQRLEHRLQRLAETLAQLLEGEIDSIDPHEEVEDDLLGRIEETVQFLVLDTKTAMVANREKEASLLMQQEELERQRQRILDQTEDLLATAATIEQQRLAIRQLSTPILEVAQDVLVMPIIGLVDTPRGEAIMASLLDSIVRKRTKWAIIDITGVESADTRTADQLARVVRAAALLGTRCVLTGIQPDVARSFTGLGVDLNAISTRRNLEDALAICLARRAS
jgi:rsbT co-antagonist protein RsbR